MHIFIDESGPFAFPSDGSPSICCVAALAVGEKDLQVVLTGFERIVSGWRLGKVEPKGSQLSERQVDKVVTHLTNFNVMLTVVVIDMGRHTKADIEAHRRGQAEKIRASTDRPEFKESAREDARALASRVEAISVPLYTQSALLTQAVWNTLQAGEIRFVQTEPKSLGNFSWRLDAKESKPTDYERTWTDIVMPMVQTISLREGLISLKGFDYSAMAPFQNPTLPKAPDHLQRGMPAGRAGPFHSSDIRKIMADLRFEDSRASSGLRLADIVANAFRRALSGRLGDRGWRRLGRLLVRDFRGGTTAKYVTLMPESKSVLSISGMPYARVAADLDRQARPWEVKR